MNIPATGLERKQNILHPATSIIELERSGARKVKQAHGIYIQDGEGNQVIDGIAGLWCSNLGHGRKEIAYTMAQAAQELDYFHTFNGHTNQAQEILAERLIAMAPKGLSQVFFGCSGSDANDTLVKIAWQYQITRGKPQKRKIISRWQAYHGTSISTASLTGLKGFHKAFALPLDFVIHTDCPFYYANAQHEESELQYTERLLSNLRALIEKEGAENIAAFIGEPIMGAGGVVTPPEGYWQGVQKICRENDILLIADEVVSGFGRIGENFASDFYGIQPDMMTTAKGITAGTFPMSAAFIADHIYEVLTLASKELGGFSHGYTYSGHPIGAAVANTVLDVMQQECITENAAKTGSYLHASLNQALASHPHVGEIRGQGLLAAVQLMECANSKQFLDPTKKLAAKVSQACYERGLIIRPLPSVNSLALSPPLILNRNQVDRIVEIVVQGINSVFIE
ncbi:MAG: aminotransferase class III-fold pyridoxal phosphate-dependent enzyme [Kangiellaceae bacterium]|nr:aminotransferase class III-fold pyridoxal phosphate-dependent enzyme [Kangiellaceae bacterium]